MGRFAVFLASILTLCSTGLVLAWTGRCVGVVDGDTIQVVSQGGPVTVRLYGVDCPEICQKFGERARKFTSKMVPGKPVQIQQVFFDRYGRPIAWVSVQGKSLNYEIVRAGLAWWYRKYAPTRTDLANLEEEARMAERGLWVADNPQPPWEWRQKSGQDTWR